MDIEIRTAEVRICCNHESCAARQAGPDFTVASGGDATLTAATRIVLTDGFVVEPGGRLVAGTDPDLAGTSTRTYGDVRPWRGWLDAIAWPF